jgi:PAS domain S-box-containing protein
MKQIDPYLENLSVLIIEDNQGDFVLIEDYLIDAFKLVEIIHFSDFQNSIDYLQNSKEKVSLILLDLHLPDMKGIDIINKVLAYNFQIPIVVLTGYSDLNLAKKSLQLGVYDYLIKDEINPVVIHKTITFALKRSDFIHQIKDEKDNYENLFNFSPQPTWLLEAGSLKILNANIAACYLYNISKEEFLNMSFTQLHPKEEKQLIENKFILKENGSHQEHFTHFINGKEIKVDIYFKEINANSSNRLIVQSNDISDSLKRMETIELQNTKLREIAWTQSHVVRAPLSRILGIINLIEDDPEGAEDLSFWLQQLKISTNEMDDIVKRIVDETTTLNPK